MTKDITAIVKARKWGSSVGVIIPHEIVAMMKLKLGDYLSLTISRARANDSDLLDALFEGRDIVMEKTKRGAVFHVKSRVMASAGAIENASHLIRDRRK